jgi:type I restriction enzyme R subunit
MNNEIKLRAPKNLAKSRKLKEEVEKIISNYHNHFFDSLIALQKLRDVARKLQGEDERLQQLGLTEEEETFYDILNRHPNALQDFELIKELVKEITALIKQKAAQPDWYKVSTRPSTSF